MPKEHLITSARKIPLDYRQIARWADDIVSTLSRRLHPRGRSINYNDVIYAKEGLKLKALDDTVYDIDLYVIDLPERIAVDGVGGMVIPNKKKPYSKIVLFTGFSKPGSSPHVDSKDFLNGLRTTLAHEVSHLVERPFYYPRIEETAPDEEYFNDKGEVRAFLQNLIVDLYDYLDRADIDLADLPTHKNTIINNFLKQSNHWNMMSSELNAKNKSLMLKALYTEVQDIISDGVGKQEK